MINSCCFLILLYCYCHHIKKTCLLISQNLFICFIYIIDKRYHISIRAFSVMFFCFIDKNNYKRRTLTALNYFHQTIVVQNEWIILRQVEFSPWFFGFAKIYQRRWAIQFSRRIIFDEAGEFSFVPNHSSKLVSVIPQFPEFPWGNCK